MKFIIGKKQEMTQLFAEDGTVLPVTKVSIEPCFVVDKKTVGKDNYSAIKLATSQSKKCNKPLTGFFKKALGGDATYKYTKEFRIEEKDEMFDKLEVGNVLTTSIFNIGDLVDVISVSKGKGFQGVVRRHGFAGSLASHGHKDQLRMPGSIGSTGPAKVFKGVRMGGHMGDQQVTLKNLEIVKVEENYIYVKGGISGAKSSLVYLVGKGSFELAKPEVVKPEIAKKDESEKKSDSSVTEVVKEAETNKEENK